MTLSLKCHPDFQADAITSVNVDIAFDGLGELVLTYKVSGDIGALELLEQTSPKRTDYLWQQTCFEAFIGAEGQKGYLEFNLSPSSEWAIYAFEDHRRGMRNPELKNEPAITVVRDEKQVRLTAIIDLTGLPDMDSNQLELAATAVIEEQNGRKSLWALAHPSGNPDFHNRDCFVHQLEGAVSQ